MVLEEKIKQDLMQKFNIADDKIRIARERRIFLEVSHQLSKSFLIMRLSSCVLIICTPSRDWMRGNN